MSNVTYGRYAAIDIGTVTCRLLIADVTEDGLKTVSKGYRITNLGDGVDTTGLLKESAIKRVSLAIDEFLQMISDADTEDSPVLKTAVMATSAARDADNKALFEDMIASKGLSLDVITGDMEASLTFKGASTGFEGKRIAVVDVGGGSTEISVGIAGDSPIVSKSFNIGSKRATERFIESDPPTHIELEAVIDWVRAATSAWIKEAVGGMSPEVLIAVAGTATSAVSIRDAMEVYDSEKVNGAVVTYEELEKEYRELAAMNLAAREKVVGLDPGRAPVIVAGMLILLGVMPSLGVTSFVASENDILQGMILFTSEL